MNMLMCFENIACFLRDSNKSLLLLLLLLVVLLGDCCCSSCCCCRGGCCCCCCWLCWVVAVVLILVVAFNFRTIRTSFKHRLKCKDCQPHFCHQQHNEGIPHNEWHKFGNCPGPHEATQNNIDNGIAKHQSNSVDE